MSPLACPFTTILTFSMLGCSLESSCMIHLWGVLCRKCLFLRLWQFITSAINDFGGMEIGCEMESVLWNVSLLRSYRLWWEKLGIRGRIMTV